MMNKVLIVLVGILAAVAADKARYDNYRLHRVVPSTTEHLESLQKLKSLNEFNFWTDVARINRPVDILVPPHRRPLFSDFLKQINLESVIQIENLQELIDSEEETMKTRSKDLEWTNYYPLEDLYAFLDKLANENNNVEVIIGGQTYEDREIRGIEIINGDNLPGLIIESGIHAREWIGPASTTWIVNQILNSSADSVWKKFNYIYFPSVNPDGYAYTHSDDRMWRKTRKPYSDACVGADPNRNYGYHWMNGGASDQPCAEDFAGSKAFSEIETKTLSDFLTKVSPRYDLHIAVHSYSQLLMFPWGYTGEHAANHNLWQRIGDLAGEALEAVHGTKFDVGNIFDTIYQTSGTSTEWYYGTFNATITYTFELRDTGRYGFVLPADQIIPVAEELSAAFETILSEYLKL